MHAQTLYAQLEKDFILPAMHDAWAQHMDDIADLIAPQFHARSMGVVCDFATDISHVYTAVFPSDDVLRTILADGTHDALLFVHHPSIWDIRRAPNIFVTMNRDLLVQLQQRRVAIYNLHVPLDHFGAYATSVTLAQALGIEQMQPFCEYMGALAGVFGTTQHTTIEALHKHFSSVIGHCTACYTYGASDIADGKIAVVAGGGLDQSVLDDMVANDVHVLITGVSAQTAYATPQHTYAQQHGITVLGGTHYSTEKFACMAMVGYFTGHGMTATFLAGEPLMEDL